MKEFFLDSNEPRKAGRTIVKESNRRYERFAKTDLTSILKKILTGFAYNIPG
jgi:hypothetical protein